MSPVSVVVISPWIPRMKINSWKLLPWSHTGYLHGLTLKQDGALRNKYFPCTQQLNLYVIFLLRILSVEISYFHSIEQQCPYVSFLPCVKVELVLLCSQINVETMKGSITQLGASDYHCACQVPLILELQKRESRLIWEFWSRAAVLCRGELKCITQLPALALGGYSVSHQSVIIQGSISQGLHILLSSNTLHSLWVMSSCGSNRMLFQWAQLDLAPCMQAIEAYSSGPRSPWPQTSLPWDTLRGAVALDNIALKFMRAGRPLEDIVAISAVVMHIICLYQNATAVSIWHLSCTDYNIYINNR